MMLARALALASGFAFTLVLAYVFGASREADAFFMALFLPNAVAALLWVQVPSALIPAYMAAPDRDALMRRALATCAWIGGAASLAIAAGAGLIANLMAPGFGAEQRDLTAAMIRILAVSALLASLGGAIRAALNANRTFFITEFDRVVGHGVTIVVIVLAAPRLGILAAAIGVLAGTAARTIVLAFAGARWIRGGRATNTGNFAGALGLLVLGEIFHHVNHGVGRYLAGGLGESAVAYLGYADRVAALAPFLVFGAVGFALAPRFSELAAAGRREEFARQATAAMRLSMAVGLPLAVVLIVGAEPILTLLFVRGEFTAEDARACAPVLWGYAPGLLGAGTFVMVQAYAALGRMARLVPIFAAAAALNAAGAAWLAPRTGAAGIALAFGVSTALAFAAGAAQLRRLALRSAAP